MGGDQFGEAIEGRLWEKRNVARRILRHLGMREHPPPIAPARFDDAGDT